MAQKVTKIEKFIPEIGRRIPTCCLPISAQRKDGDGKNISKTG